MIYVKSVMFMSSSMTVLPICDFRDVCEICDFSEIHDDFNTHDFMRPIIYLVSMMFLMIVACDAQQFTIYP
jgi:hypothetical protein